MNKDNGKTEERGETMWRVAPEMRDRVDAYMPILQRKLGIRYMSRAQVIEYLLNKGLEVEGAPGLTAVDAG